jgi:hypothetical protein
MHTICERLRKETSVGKCVKTFYVHIAQTYIILTLHYQTVISLNTSVSILYFNYRFIEIRYRYRYIVYRQYFFSVANTLPIVPKQSAPFQYTCTFVKAFTVLQKVTSQPIKFGKKRGQKKIHVSISYVYRLVTPVLSSHLYKCCLVVERLAFRDDNTCVMHREEWRLHRQRKIYTKYVQRELSYKQ